MVITQLRVLFWFHSCIIHFNVYSTKNSILVKSVCRHLCIYLTLELPFNTFAYSHASFCNIFKNDFPVPSPLMSMWQLSCLRLLTLFRHIIVALKMKITFSACLVIFKVKLLTYLTMHVKEFNTFRFFSLLFLHQIPITSTSWKKLSLVVMSCWTSRHEQNFNQ